MAALRWRPQSFPILVEDAHGAVGVAQVRIIVRGKSQPGIGAITLRCSGFKNAGEIAPSLKKTVEGHWNHGARPPSCPREYVALYFDWIIDSTLLHSTYSFQGTPTRSAMNRR